MNKRYMYKIFELLILLIVIFIVLSLVIENEFGIENDFFPSGDSNQLVNVMIEDIETREYRQAVDKELMSVKIIREDKSEPFTAIGMELKKGDQIKTGNECDVILSLKDSVIILAPNTHIKINEISHPKTSLLEGEIYLDVKKNKLKEKYSTGDMEYVNAVVKGTKFYISVEKKAIPEICVVVLDGIVSVESKQQLWNPKILEKYQKSMISGQAPPDIKKVGKDNFSGIIEWINEIELVTRENDLNKSIGWLTYVREKYVRQHLFLVARYQKLYRMMDNTYSNNIEALDIKLSDEIAVKIARADKKDFIAEATHKHVPGYIWTIDSARNFKRFKMGNIRPVWKTAK